MKTYKFYFIDSESNVLKEVTYSCYDDKDAKLLADRLFAETMQNDCVDVTYQEL